MLTANDISRYHTAALPYAQYIARGTPPQIENWKRVYDAVQLSTAQQTLLAGFTRQLKVIALSGRWCGDCVQQGPLLQRIAEGALACIDLRWLERDDHHDLQHLLRINAGDRVPVVIFAAEDHELVSIYGDRTLSRYRAIAARQLGPSCPLPGAALDSNEAAATLQDWLNEFERVHLLLRLSARLRQKHRD